MTNDERATPAGGVATLKCAVLGAGLMGRGIIEVLAGAGYEVTAFDPVATGYAGGREHVVECADVAEAVAGVDIVFEAIIEDLEAKHALYRQIERANPTAPIASNTSTFVPSRLAQGLQDASRLVIAHFFNPADVVPLVELVPGPQTSPDVLDRVRAALASAGKSVVVLDKESVGFVANRLQAALVREVMHLVGEGVASTDVIDLVMTDCLAPRWMAAGPFQTMDRGGLDVWQKVCQQIFPTLDDSARPTLIDAYVDRGDLGLKTGRGFYEHCPGAKERGDRAVSQAFEARENLKASGNG